MSNTSKSENCSRKSWDNSSKKRFKFIDLFAGIGGFRIAGEYNGGSCVFSSEWDKNSCHTYEVNHGEMPAGDITKISADEIPDHDVLFAGFPCQAFSISGKQNGFDDTRGTLFFDVARIIKTKRPKMFLLENVKNLLRHDGGKTFSVISNTLDELGYDVHYKVLRSSDYGVPQARERIYIVGFECPQKFNFPSPVCDKDVRVVADVLELDGARKAKIIDKEIHYYNKPDKPNDRRRPYQIGYFNKGGQGERVYSPLAAGITLSAFGGGAAGRTGAYKIGEVVRKLTPRECARLQGFPDDFEIPVSDNLAYKQFGDSVSVPVLEKIVAAMLEAK